MKITIFNLCLVLLLGSLQAADVIVSGGVPTGLARYEKNGWKTQNSAFSGEGSGNLLMTRRIYRGNRFSVTLKLALRELHGTAAAVCTGDIVWGLDSRNPDGMFFVETAKDADKVRLLGPAGKEIQPGKPFTLKITGEKGVMTLLVNGRKIGNYRYPEKQDFFFAVRPHRNKASVYEFQVHGTPAGQSSSLLPRPVCRTPLPIDKDAEVLLPLADDLPPGNYNANLSGTAFPCELDSDGIALIPQSVLSKAYQAQPSHFNAKGVELCLLRGETSVVYRCAVTLYDPAHEVDFPKGEVRQVNGSRGLFLDGNPVGTITANLTYISRDKRFCGDSANRFASAGIHGNIILLSPGMYFHNGTFHGKKFLSEIGVVIAKLIAENPDARLVIYFPLYMPFPWLSAHKDELIVLDNQKDSLVNAPGKRRQPSYASESWRRDAGNMLRSAVKALRSSPFADRIQSFRLCYANSGEWNHWGYHEKAFVDYSRPMQQAFGTWLKKKYGTEDALRKAWGRNEVDFNSENLVPSRENRLKGGDFLRLGGADTQNTVDYYAFFQEYAADTILHFAKIVKDASGRRLAVGAYYGYYFGHYGNNPYHFQDSGHYGVGKLLRSPDIDFIGGPYQYANRRLQLEVNGIAGSVNLHGKIWESEGDQRTHRSGEKNKIYGTTDNLSESIAIAKRDFMVNLQRKSSYYFYDFVSDWYRDPEFMATVRQLRKIDSALRSIKREDRSEVAVLFSEETVPYLASRSSGTLGLFVRNQLAQLPRLGMPVDYYLLSDLDKIDFSRYKAVIFANACYANDEIIRKVQEYAAKNNRTLIFLHAPGIVGDGNRLDLKQSKRLTGITLQADPDASAAGIKAAWGQIKNASCRFRTWINDPSAGIIAFHDDGTPAGAERQFRDHKSIVICHPLPNAVFLRGLLGREKVHCWASGKSGLDQVNFAGPLISVYSRTGGDKTIWLPESVEVVADLFTGEILGRNRKTINFKMPSKPETRILYAGSAAEYELFRP